MGRTRDLFKKIRDTKATFHAKMGLIKDRNGMDLFGRKVMTNLDTILKSRDSKGTFHAKMGSVKDRNGMGLTEAEDIKKRWQEYTEELYRKDLHDPDNHNGVI